MSSPGFVSYAQHGEDVVIWRALGHVEDGFYVDVGAADPTEDSVTRALYDRGWRGIHVEALSDYAGRLREVRAGDVVVEAAAGAEPGEMTFYRVPDTGLSTVVAREAMMAAERGYEVSSVTVPVRTIDSMLQEHVPAGRDIHVMKVDVEGAEEAALRGAALERWRPWVVVVEATRPNSTERTSQAWEHLVADAGYVVTMFDGLNLWFRRADLPELEAPLSYPACPLDTYTRPPKPGPTSKAVEQAKQAQAEADSKRAEADAKRAQAEKKAAALAADLDRTRRRLRALERSPWWRMTRPGRSVVHRAKRVLRRRRPAAGPSPAAVTPAVPQVEPPAVPAPAPLPTVPAPAPLPTGTPHEVVAARLRALLEADGAAAPGDDEALRREVVERLGRVDRDRWLWALHVAYAGSMPDDGQLQGMLGLLDVEGPAAVLEFLTAAAEAVPAGAWTRTAGLELVTAPLVDVTHTATHDLHSGIQRVVREAVPRWQEQNDLQLGVVDLKQRAYRRCSEVERQRVLSWPPTAQAREATSEEPTTILLPWGTVVIVPELPAEFPRADSLRGMAIHSGNQVGLIAYDMTPVTCAELSSDTMPSGFARFLSVLKHADRLTAISETVAHEFESFVAMLPAQGLDGPQTRAHLLPSVPTGTAGEAAASALDDPAAPLVLSVSTIHRRKNQLRTLQAAEHLWREGLSFELVFMGSGAGVKREAFDEAVAHLKALGRPVHVLADVSDDLLWRAYRDARCTVYVSLVEGFGLPAAESLSVGTPVVLTRHGSMAEIGAGGGAVLVDPRDVDDIARGLRSLLTDDVLHAELSAAALARTRTTWDDYARATWDWLVEGKDRGGG